MLNVLRFVDKTRSQNNIHRDAYGYERALRTLVAIHQSQHIHDDCMQVKNGLIEKDRYGIWRSTSIRLLNLPSHLAARQPIFLPSTGHFVTLLIRNVHEKLHHSGTEVILNELKAQYWIPRARNTVKKVLRNCVACRRMHNLPFKCPESPPLPLERILQSSPFSHIGIDYLGPFRGENDANYYILLLTCLATRLLHLEVVNSLNTNSFLYAFRRFCARRGCPLTVISDKAARSRLLAPF